MHIIGIAGVEGRRERNFPAHTHAPRRKPKRALGCNVDGIRPETVDHARNCILGKKGEADFGIAGQRDRAESIRRDDFHHMSHRLQRADGSLQRAHHAIDLRGPGICDDQDHARMLRRAAHQDITLIQRRLAAHDLIR